MIICGRNACTEALKNNRLTINKVFILDGGPRGQNAKAGGQAMRNNDFVALCKQRGANFAFVNKETLNRVSNGASNQGIVVQAVDFVFAELDDVLKTIKKEEKEAFFVICSEITDPHNLGAIIRSADFAGANCVIISKNNSCPINETVFKTSAGACFNLPIVQASNIAQIIEVLKKNNIFVYACEAGGSDYTATDLTGNTALVIGGEDAGVKPIIKKTCDQVISIINNGKVGSLNASVAAAVVLFEAARQRAK